MTDFRHIIPGMSVYLEASVDPKEVVFEAGGLIGTEEAVEVLEMNCPDREQGSLLLLCHRDEAGHESVPLTTKLSSQLPPIIQYIHVVPTSGLPSQDQSHYDPNYAYRHRYL
jgi:hypothetical protein